LQEVLEEYKEKQKELAVDKCYEALALLYLNIYLFSATGQSDRKICIISIIKY